jgi:hypothetical protein
MGAESMPAAPQLGPQFLMIVDFAIEDDGRVAIFGGNGLVSRLEVNDLQAGCTHRDGMCFEDTLLVGSAVDQRCRRVSNATGIRNPVLMCKAGNPAQLAASPPAATLVAVWPLTIGI